MRARSIHSTLTRHFLRRFLENDLISPDADRSQLLAVVGAMLFSLTLLITLFMSFVYVSARLTPSQLAISALNDRFFYISLSMVVCALLAVAQWDSLVVDVRDAAILEPLPVRPTVIRRAKLAAVAILGAGAAVLVNVMPTLTFPWLLVYHTQLRVVDMLRLIATHAVVAGAAAAFAYVAVIALRETLAALFTPRWLSVFSAAVQGGLIVVLGSCLLLIPPASTRIEQRGFSGSRALLPPTWFLGLHETLAGDILRDAPRPRLSARRARADVLASMAYDRHHNDFAAMARRAGTASALTVLIAVVSHWWNARRFPSVAPFRGRRQRWRAGGMLARMTIRDQTTRAGFFFTLATVWRSNVHRLALACAGAATVAVAVVTLSGIDLQNLSGSTAVPVSIFMIQPIFYGALLVAFRHGIRVPAELRANWAFQLAWRDRDRAFLAGSKRAALVGIVLPALLLVLPLFSYLLGTRAAIAHAALGLAGAVAMLEALLFWYEKVPFTCTYLPNESFKAFGILYLVVFLVGAAVFAGMQRDALHDPMAAFRLVAILVAIVVAFRIASARRAGRGPVDFNEAPVTTQRLGLHT